MCTHYVLGRVALPCLSRRIIFCVPCARTSVLIDFSIFLLNFGLCASYVIIIGDNLTVSPLLIGASSRENADEMCSLNDRLPPSIAFPAQRFITCHPLTHQFPSLIHADVRCGSRLAANGVRPDYWQVRQSTHWRARNDSFFDTHPSHLCMLQQIRHSHRNLGHFSVPSFHAQYVRFWFKLTEIFIHYWHFRSFRLIAVQAWPYFTRIPSHFHLRVAEKEKISALRHVSLLCLAFISMFVLVVILGGTGALEVEIFLFQPPHDG